MSASASIVDARLNRDGRDWQEEVTGEDERDRPSRKSHSMRLPRIIPPVRNEPVALRGRNGVPYDVVFVRTKSAWSMVYGQGIDPTE
ncbi:MAG: hypothetical protein ACREIG_02940 [Nitrospiraceae bacterium]